MTMRLIRFVVVWWFAAGFFGCSARYLAPEIVDGETPELVPPVAIGPWLIEREILMVVGVITLGLVVAISDAREPRRKHAAPKD